MANQVGKTEVAIDLISQAIAKLPKEPDFHGNLAAALDAAGRVGDAIRHYREAIRLKPSAVTQRVLLGEALQQQGNLAEALEVLQEARQIDSRSAQVFCVLGDLAAFGHYTLTDADIKCMQELLQEGRQSIADASLLNFTLAAHWERVGDYDEAFDCYRRANEFKLQVYQKDKKTFDRERHRRLVADLISVFTPEFMEKTRRFGVDSEVPVFVVGLVRSGTTLVEQILSSHPEVHGAGERKDIDQLAITMHVQLQSAPYPASMNRLEPGLVRSMAYGYLMRMAKEAGTASRIVDKMPQNFLHLGLIAVLFPRVHIVHCRRDPMDVCSSAYFQNFKFMNFAATLDDIAFYYREYAKLMDHWRRVLPVPIHEVVYEEMVANTEAESRNLVAACGLEWDERCLAYYRTKRHGTNGQQASGAPADFQSLRGPLEELRSAAGAVAAGVGASG